MLGLAFSVHLLQVPLEEQMSGVSQDYVLLQPTQSHCKHVVWSPTHRSSTLSWVGEIYLKSFFLAFLFGNLKARVQRDGELPLCLMLSFSPHEVVFSPLRDPLDLQCCILS